MQSTSPIRIDEQAPDERTVDLARSLLDGLWYCVTELTVAVRNVGTDAAAIGDARAALAATSAARTDTARTVRSALRDRGPTARPRLRGAERALASLVDRIDAVADGIERAVAAMDARRLEPGGFVRAHLAAMTAHLVDAADRLRSGTLACVRALGATDGRPIVDRAIDEIERHASACRDHDDALFDAAYAGGSRGAAADHRNVAEGLSAVATATERAGDELATLAAARWSSRNK